MSVMSFQCNICNNAFEAEWNSLSREQDVCKHCGGWQRMREIAHALQTKVYGMDNPKVVGLSDWKDFGKHMTASLKIRYQNTYMHKYPRLDICSPKKNWFDSAEVLNSSDVFEHTLPPFEDSLIGSRNILKKNGVLILTMPWTTNQSSLEHYPWMKSYRVKKRFRKTPKVIGVDSTGNKHEIFDPIFHGGPGYNLEMRLLNLQSLVESLESLGFTDIEVDLEDIPKYGINRSLGGGVITARKANSS